MKHLSHKNIISYLPVFLLLAFLLFPSLNTAAQQNQTSRPMPAETVLLSTDRSIYLSGETIYLSAIILESDNFKVSSLSRVMRIELLDCEEKTGIRNILYSDKGTLAGTIKIPANLPTGWYRLRAYTSWMRNRGPSLFSFRDLRIINPADGGRLREYALDDTLMVSVIAANGPALTGARNHCAVRSVSRRGRPMAVKGSLVSSRNDTVTHFSTGDTGWGTIDWIPEQGYTYRIVVESDPGIPVETAIPEHTDSTVSVTISDPILNGDDPGKDRNITVTLTGNIPDTGIKLLVHRVSSWYNFNEAIPRNKRLSFVVPTEGMPEGLTAFSFLDIDNRMLASTLWIKGDPLAGSGSVTTKAVDGENDAGLITEYKTGSAGVNAYYTLITRRREPVEIPELFIAAMPGWNTAWDIPADSYEREGWLIANAYEGFIAESFFKEGRRDPSVPLINFNDITATRQSMVEFVPETRGIKLSGMLTFDDGTPAGFQILSLTSLNENLFKTTRTFSDGRFHFTFPGREGSKDFLLSYINRPAEKMTLVISSEFDQRLSGLPPDKIYLTEEEKEYINELIIDSRLENIYRDTTAGMPAVDEQKYTDKAMFYGNPDRVIYIDDYIKLPDMREVIFEVVPFVTVRKEGEDFSLKVIGENPFPRIYDPLFLIDGIPLLRFNRLLELPPDRFKKIDVINSLHIHGNQVFAGVVNFISVNEDLAGLDLPEGSRLLSLDLPGPSNAGDLVTGTSYVTDIPILQRTLSYTTLSNTSEGSLLYSGKPANGNYISFFTGINANGRWVSLSSAFEIR